MPVDGSGVGILLSLITLTTDFGTRDWFVGTMKGVILGIAPQARIVDLTHGIPPGDVRAGAFALLASCRFFSKGTVHVAVVDPGVGSARRAIAVQTRNFHLVGRDNGVLSWVLAQEQIIGIRELRNDSWFNRPVSRTFHGRDVFAPVAAHLGLGVPLAEFGPALTEIARLAWPEVSRAGEHLLGEIIYVDHFGNAVTNIAASALEILGRNAGFEVLREEDLLCAVESCYWAVPVGKPVAVVGSSGFLEIAINGGNAADALQLPAGTRISVSLRP